MKNAFCALILALTACAAQARDSNAIRSEILTQSGHSWDGASLPAYPAGEPEITILRVVIPPGLSLPWHRHPYINAGVLITGELTVETETDMKIQLKAGDSIVELVNTWHHGVNRGTIPAEIIVFYAGVKGSPVTLEKP